MPRPLIRGVALASLVLGLLASPAGAALPSGWPHRFELGLTSEPGAAAAQRAKAPFGFRCQYLVGGVNTGSGWSTWDADGTFVSRYVSESRAERDHARLQLLHAAPVAARDRR